MNWFVRCLLSLSAALLLLAGCSTKVTRVAPDSTIDLTGRWNDADSRLVAEEMIQDCLSKPWLASWEQAQKKPSVIVGTVRNKSHEHISLETFTKNMELALVNSGRVTFVASKAEREEIREELADQQENASAQTAKTEGEETGADLMLSGTINAIVDQEGSKAVIYYQTNLELIGVQSHEKVWIGEKKIKKYVERAQVTY
jgi:uncharacterized protein (TIGR02722 family)